MPIVNFYLVEDLHPQDAIEALLVDASWFYVETLYPDMDPRPIERVRAFVTTIPARHWATGGQLVVKGGLAAPYFRCLALSGRPLEQLHALMAGFTDLVVKHLGCQADVVRGEVIPVDPAHWSIAGRPASTVRINESAMRSGE